MKKKVTSHLMKSSRSITPLKWGAQAGAEGRTRTGTGKPPKDFKSFASAISPPRHIKSFYFCASHLKSWPASRSLPSPELSRRARINVGWRRHPDSNRGVRVLQTLALPLGYAANAILEIICQYNRINK